MTTSLQNDFPAIYGKLMSSYGLASATVGFINGQLQRNHGSVMALKANMVTNIARAIYSTDYRNDRTVGEIKSDLRDMPLYELGALNYALMLGEDNFEFGHFPNDEMPNASSIGELLRDVQSIFLDKKPEPGPILELLISEYQKGGLN
ncbi:hypothetical protein TOTORO_01040 [Serratia phage vB_SmaS-Totoro]|nr:hypothetical protein TOTORO_01040 [Serratia phage vB_SmaS-Totoro]